MKNARIIKRVLAFAMAAAMTMSFAGCGDNGGKSSSTSPSSEAPKDTASVADDSSAEEDTPYDPTTKYEGKDLGGRTIKIAFNWDYVPNTTAYVLDPSKDGEGISMQIERMKAIEEKYNCKIECINLPYDDRIEKITSSVMANAPIADVVLLDIAQILPLAKNEIIMPYDDILPANADVINEKIVMEPQGKLFGKIYAIEQTNLPINGQPLGVNMDIINSLGLEKTPVDLWEAGEWTWDAFLDVAKKATKDTDGDGKIDQWGISGPAQTLLEMFTASNDGAFFDDVNKKQMFDDKKTMAAFDFFNKLYNVEKVARIQNDYTDYAANQDAFKDGKSAFFWSPQWLFPDGENKVKLNYTMIDTPKGPDNTGKYSYMQKMGGKCLVNGVKDPQIVYQILEEFHVPMDLDFEIKLEGTREWLQGKFPTDVDIDRFLKVGAEGGKDDASNGISGYPTGAIVDGLLKEGKTPAQVVEENKQIAQGKIDEMFK